jgi:Domain of unknown function (DUF4760)
LGVAVAGVADIWSWISYNAAPIQTVAVVVSAVAAFLVIWHNGKVERRKATIDLIAKTFFDGEIHNSYQVFKDIFIKREADPSSSSIISLESLATKENQKHDDSECLNQVLNQYELISLSIKQKALDEQFYKQWFFTQFTKDYQKTLPFINALRKYFNLPTIYCEYTSLAERWLRKPHPLINIPIHKRLWRAVRNEPYRLPDM